MPKTIQLVCCLVLACAVACHSGRQPEAPAHDADTPVDAGLRIDSGAPAAVGGGHSGTGGAIAGAGSPAAISGGSTADCAGSAGPDVLGIAQARLSTAVPLSIEQSGQLTGEGLMSTLLSTQNVTAGLRVYDGGLFMLADHGFWDIPSDGPARRYATDATLIIGIRAGDVDGDGDQDVLLMRGDLSSAPDDDAGSGTLVTRLTVWERTPAGLAERAEVLRVPGFVLPMPFVFGDPDGDRDLDVLTFEHGAPVVYVNDGALHFERSVRGEAAPAYADKLLGWVDYADRDRDGVSDLLVITGEALELEAFVLLGEANGRFAAPGPAAKLMPSLVPHGPSGTGFGFADVTGDGVSDLLMQDPTAPEGVPRLLLRASVGATELGPPLPLPVLGFGFADVDQDGTTDIVGTQDHRFVVLLARGQGKFETRDLGLNATSPPLKTFTVDPARRMIHLLYAAPTCTSCPVGCMGRCMFDACLGCLTDADCMMR
jgi:hypothetical protein